MDRKRVNISLDPDTYGKLQKLRKAYGFKNMCEVVTAMVHVMLDRTESAGSRRFDLPDDDGDYIDGMFEEFSHYERTPADTAPPRQRRDRKERR